MQTGKKTRITINKIHTTPKRPSRIAISSSSRPRRRSRGAAAVVRRCQGEQRQDRPDRHASLRSAQADFRSSKSSSDKAAQIMLDQIDALRSDQVKFLSEATPTGDKAAQSLRQETAASQAKLAARPTTSLKLTAAPPRHDATRRRDEEGHRRREKELRRGPAKQSNISPGFALIVALAALVFGPFLGYKFTANQLAAARHPEATAAAQAQAANMAEAESPLAPTAATDVRRRPFSVPKRYRLGGSRATPRRGQISTSRT